MKKTFLPKWQIVALAGLFLLLGYTTGAWALATFDSETILTMGVSITNQGGGTTDALNISADIEVDPSTSSSGNVLFVDAFADLEGLFGGDQFGIDSLQELTGLSLLAGDTIVLTASALGRVEAPPDSFSDGVTDIISSINIFNSSDSDTFLASFQFGWEALVSAGITSPFESARADGFLSVTSFYNGAPFGLPQDFTSSAPGDGPIDINFPVDFTLLPGDSARIIIFNIASGSAESKVAVAAVPEPATLLLLGAGLIGLTGLGRRRLTKAM